MNDSESVDAPTDPLERRRMQNRHAQRNFRNRRNQHRVSQALAASPIHLVPNDQCPSEHHFQQGEGTQQPTPPYTHENASLGTLDFNFDQLFNSHSLGAANNALQSDQQVAMESSSSLLHGGTNASLQTLQHIPLDIAQDLQPSHFVLPQPDGPWPSPGPAVSKSPLANRVRSPTSDDERLPVLHIAAFRGRTSIVSLLLDQSLFVNEQDSSGHTPLHLAAMKGHAELMSLLLGRGAIADMKDNKGRTPIHWAALNQQEGALKVLINQGADVNAADNNDWTVIHVCAERGWQEGLRAVLHAGADTSRKAKKCEIWKRQEVSA